jgi:glycosyltransferase involved in cell wall biosynthesis
MRRLVAIDLRRATLWPHTGIGRYARSLMREMLALDPLDLDLRAIDLADSAAWDGALPAGIGSSAVRRLVQEQWHMARLSRRVDLLHLPWCEGPARPHAPLVLTLFDLATLDGARGYDWTFRAYYNTLLRLHIRRAALILVASETSLEAVTARFPGKACRCIPLGVDPVFRSDNGESRSAEPTVLYSGGYDPRKRVGDLLGAIAAIRKHEPDTRLVLTGRPPPTVLEAAHAALGSALVLTGYVDDDELAAWYRRAWAVAYPTDLEGFGFPVVEAFASGTPVVATSGGSVGELLAGAGLLSPPGDSAMLAEHLLAVLQDDVLRDRLTAAGLSRASRFRWPDVAAETLDAYRDVLS